MPGKIFINYRRDDEAGFAHALCAQLERRFDQKQLFIDVDHIPAGTDFAAYIGEQIAQCEVFVAIIGPRWLSAGDAQGGRRLDDPKDFVRLEIESAIGRNKRLIPVLVNGARMPPESELPETLWPLARHQALSLSTHRFKADVQHVAASVERNLQEALAAQFGKSTQVALVHGIGDVEPAGLLRKATSALVDIRPGLVIDDNLHVHAARGQTYLSGSIYGQDVRVAACYWDDLARFGDRLPDLIRGILFGGLNSPYFGEVGVETNNAATRIFSQAIFWLLSLMIAVLALLALPVAVISMIASAASLAAYYLFPVHVGNHAPFIIATTLCTGAWVAYLGSTQALYVGGARTLGFWLFISIIAFIVMFGVALGIGQLALAGGTQGIGERIHVLIEHASPLLGLDSWTNRIGGLNSIGIHLAFLSWLQQAFGLVLVALAALIPFLLVITYVCSLGRWTNGRSLLLACILVIGMWFALQFAIWPEHLISSGTLSLFSNPDARILKASHLDIATWKWSDATDLSAGLVQRYYLLNWYDVLFFAFLLLTIALVVSVQSLRWLWSWAHTKADLTPFKPHGTAPGPSRTGAPRLIISWPIWLLALLFMLFVALSVIATIVDPSGNAVDQVLKGHTSSEQLKLGVYVSGDYVRIGVILSIGIFALLARSAKGPVQVLLDVINHFYAPHRGYPIRRQIAGRLQRTLEFLLANDDKPHLVVVAHSQGSIVAIETLFGTVDRDGLWQQRPEGWAMPLCERVSSLTVVTFGSPLTHIYQCYFPQAYPALGSIGRFVNAAHDPKVRWINAYRVDDYAGMHVENSIEGFPRNVPCAVGGHLNYWHGRVFAKVFAEPGMHTVLAPIEVAEREPGLLQ